MNTVHDVTQHVNRERQTTGVKFRVHTAATAEATSGMGSHRFALCQAPSADEG